MNEPKPEQPSKELPVRIDGTTVTGGGIEIDIGGQAFAGGMVYFGDQTERGREVLNDRGAVIGHIAKYKP